MSSEAEILAGVREVASTRLGLDRDLELESRLVEDLGLDSLRLQGLAIEVENHFRICLEPEDEESILTVRDLVKTIYLKKTAESKNKVTS